LVQNILKKFDVNDYSLAHLNLILLLHYFVKFKVVVWAFATMNFTGYRMRWHKND